MPGWRSVLGTLIILPGVILLWGSHWDFGLRLDHRWLLPLLALGWFSLSRVAGGTGGASRRASSLAAFWGRWDPLFAALLIQAVLFRSPQDVLLPGLILLLLFLSLLGLRRAAAPVLVALLCAFIIFAILLPRAFRSILIARVSATYELDVDHRLWPDGKEINSDGARFRAEAEDLDPRDYVVLFLGDSFTFGWNLPYEDAYPYRLESLAGAAGCDPELRVVNMGWTSSSPLLGMRLLRQVGYKYRPDLIVYSLDTTDFHDDLRYERRLRNEEDYEFDPSAIAERWIASEIPWAERFHPLIFALTRRLRAGGDEARNERLTELDVPRAGERFFVTAYPLDESRAAIELGVMKNLEDMNRFSRDVLGVPMALILYPRAYQYSDREVPRNWEKGYRPLGPYVLEPFRYFAEVEDSLPYPVFSLLPAFEQSEEFPLFFANDPHWNARGGAVAAENVLRGLVDLGLLPCEGDRLAPRRSGPPRG